MKASCLLLAVWLPGGMVAAKPPIHVLSLRQAGTLPREQRYDLCHAAVCIQGLANREAPRVFLDYHAEDSMWLTRLCERGGLCEGWPIHKLSDFDDLLNTFRAHIKGVVLYDADPDTGVISTSLVATTVAGVEGAIALRKDTSPGSLYQRLVNEPDGPRLPVLLDLTGRFTGQGTIWETSVPSTGSARCDAYLWAKAKYIDTGRCDPALLSYTLDLWGLRKPVSHEATQLSNLDYAVRRKGFCFELSCWGDEKPNDDPDQPLGTDRRTFQAILDACNAQTRHRRMIQLCGFTNWPFKYTDRQGGRHEPVETEWHLAAFLSAYNVYTEADAAAPQYISNASFYAGLLPAVAQRRYVQNPPPTPGQLRADGLLDEHGQVPDGNYIMMALGDYDQASWVLYRLGTFYDDRVRGQVPCNWGVDPNAVDRACVAMDYFYRHKTAKDYFAAWDSGAGYVNPSRLQGSRDPSGYPGIIPVWREHCRKYYRQFDYSITSWIISPGERITSKDLGIYTLFSADGVGTQAAADIRSGEHLLVGNMPVSERVCIDGPGADELINFPAGVHFTWYRTILWRPEQLRRIEADYARIARQKYRFLDVYTYYYLLRCHLGGGNTHRATWVADTIPRLMKAGGAYDVTLTVRNDGWDAWTESGNYRLGCAIVAAGVSAAAGDYDAGTPNRVNLPAGETVKPGQTVTFPLHLVAPVSAGSYDVYCDLVQDGASWFRDRGNIEWQRPVLVAADPASVDTDADGAPDMAETEKGSLHWHPDDRPASAPILR